MLLSDLVFWLLVLTAASWLPISAKSGIISRPRWLISFCPFRFRHAANKIGNKLSRNNLTIS